MKQIRIVCLVLLGFLTVGGVPARAAFTAPTICPDGGNVALPDGEVRITLCFPSNSGEHEVRATILIGPTSDPLEVEYRATEIMNALNSSRTTGRQLKYQPGQVVNAQVRPVSVVSSAVKVCLGQYRQVTRDNQAGVFAAGTLATAISTARTTLATCYNDLTAPDKVVFMANR